MPFGSSKAAMMGAAGAGGGFGYEYSGSQNQYTNWNSTGYTFVELTTSGNLEFTGDGTIDMVVVGGGGGYDVGSSTNQENGGGGGGGVVQVTSFEVVAETIAVTIGAKGTYAVSGGSSGTNGGQTELTMNGVNIAAGGGGRGGMGGWGYCSTGQDAPALTSPPSGWGSITRASGGGGGGGGRWYTYCGAGGGAGRAGLYAGTPASGTWWPNNNSSAGIGGNGANSSSYDAGGGAGGGSGGGYDTQNSRTGQNMPGLSNGQGGNGIRWQNYGYGQNGSVSTTTAAFYGSGAGRAQSLNPSGDSFNNSGWGKGAAWVDGGAHGAPQNGVVILRFADI
tara:strand:- start:971 stop:1975 length:1005 start_codon:yes stop_codon:yes gene_type:complete